MDSLYNNNSFIYYSLEHDGTSLYYSYNKDGQRLQEYIYKSIPTKIEDLLEPRFFQAYHLVRQNHMPTQTKIFITNYNDTTKNVTYQRIDYGIQYKNGIKTTQCTTSKDFFLDYCHNHLFSITLTTITNYAELIKDTSNKSLSFYFVNNGDYTMYIDCISSMLNVQVPVSCLKACTKLIVYYNNEFHAVSEQNLPLIKSNFNELVMKRKYGNKMLPNLLLEYFKQNIKLYWGIKNSFLKEKKSRTNHYADILTLFKEIYHNVSSNHLTTYQTIEEIISTLRAIRLVTWQNKTLYPNPIVRFFCSKLYKYNIVAHDKKENQN